MRETAATKDQRLRSEVALEMMTGTGTGTATVIERTEIEMEAAVLGHVVITEILTEIGTVIAGKIDRM